MLNTNDMNVINAAWERGLAKASFGSGKGTCAMTGGKDGFVVLYLCADKAQLKDDYKAGIPYLFSISGYKILKAQLDETHGAPKGRKLNIALSKKRAAIPTGNKITT